MTAVVGTVLFIGVLVFLPIIGALASGRFDLFGDDGPPSCASEPAVLEWSDSDRGWRRTGRFTLEESQIVQVDVDLWNSDGGGVLDFGVSTVYAVPAGEPFPEFGDSAATTSPFLGIRVGSGKDAVNEQLRLDPGVWELIMRDGASAAEVRWPC
jgi:hypothetical protein